VVWAGGGVRSAGDGVDDEVDNGESENRNNQTDDSIEDGVLGVGDFLAVTTGCNIAETTIDKHDDRDNADGIKDGISNLSENAIFTDKLGRHTIATSSLGTFLDGEGHNFASGKSESGRDAGQDSKRCFCNFVHLILAVNWINYSTERKNLNSRSRTER